MMGNRVRSACNQTFLQGENDTLLWRESCCRLFTVDSIQNSEILGLLQTKMEPNLIQNMDLKYSEGHFCFTIFKYFLFSSTIKPIQNSEILGLLTRNRPEDRADFPPEISHNLFLHRYFSVAAQTCTAFYSVYCSHAAVENLSKVCANVATTEILY